MMIRAFGMMLAATLLFVASGPAAAQQAKCLAGKTKCVAKKGTGLLKCHTNAETPGKPADPNAGGCIDKVVGKFDGGIDPTKGCFEKLENQAGNDCQPPTGNSATLQGLVEDCDFDLEAVLTETSTTTSTTLATTTTLPPCQANVGGFCWALGAAGEDCDAACAPLGKTCGTGTVTYAGSSGTQAQCDAVLTALGQSATLLSAPCTDGYGCNVGSIGVHCSSPATTCGAATAGVQRACACE